ncbi:MAG: glucose sorbosone dehydrogenase, partial [Prosthecobacter sp.]|nr:glucose sorbosone dehydrogenase [Prosthecobacter sp.]
MKFAALTATLLLAGSALAADAVKLTRVYEKLETLWPITVQIPADGSQRQFLALQRGQILILPKDEQSSVAKTFVDLSGNEMEATDGKFEEGINGFAFHPKFKE